MLAATGVLGLVSYVALHDGTVWCGLRALRARPTDTEMIVVVGIWVGAFLTLASLNLIRPNQNSYAVFWLLVGMVVATADERTTRLRSHLI